MVKIDLGNTYELMNASLDREHTQMEFLCPQTDGTARIIRVEIKPHHDPFLTGVSNLAMGPVTESGELDDQIRLKHKDRAVVYSTLLFCMLGFLNQYPDLTVGLDGSDDLRAAIYHSIFLSNGNSLGDYFVSVGLTGT